MFTIHLDQTLLPGPYDMAALPAASLDSGST